LDACNGVVFADDNQVVRLVIVKRYSETPGTFIRIRPLLLEAA